MYLNELKVNIIIYKMHNFAFKYHIFYQSIVLWFYNTHIRVTLLCVLWNHLVTYFMLSFRAQINSRPAARAARPARPAQGSAPADINKPR